MNETIQITEEEIEKNITESKYCCLCNSKFEKFLPWERSHNGHSFLEHLKCVGSDIVNFYCPKCRATDRDRHLWLYLDKTGIYDSLCSGTRVMHIAPEIPIIKRLLLKTKNVVAGDLFPERYKNRLFDVKKIDLTEIDADDGSFHILIANHVLEHIENYKKALKEIRRVLCNDGIAILQTPFSQVIYKNFEDPMINTNEARKKFYGQNDHVRVFGWQLFDDIKETGLKSHYISHEQLLKEFNSDIYGVNPNEGLILAIK